MSSAGKVELEWWPSGTIPAPASIVWCNFPDHLSSDFPGPKARPGLVFKVRYASTPPDGRFLVLVAYGTSNLKLNTRPFDFIIGNSATLNALRLPSATRFDLDQVLWLPWAKPFFNPRRPGERGATPNVSVVPEGIQRQLAWTMAEREQRGMNAGFKSDPPGTI